MGRASSLARAAQLTRPSVAYIHRFTGVDRWHACELSWSQLDRTADWVAAQLAAQGLRRPARAIVTFSGFEGPWARPVMDGVRRLGVIYCTAEPAGWDHARVRFLHAELGLSALIGLSLETVEALSEVKPVGELFDARPLLLVRPEAVGRLRDAGVDAGTLALVGPALGVECRERVGVHVDGASWQLEERDGHAVISGAPGGPALASTTLPLKGRVLHEPCACGSTDPRLVLTT